MKRMAVVVGFTMSLFACGGPPQDSAPSFGSISSALDGGTKTVSCTEICQYQCVYFGCGGNGSHTVTQTYTPSSTVPDSPGSCNNYCNSWSCPPPPAPIWRTNSDGSRTLCESCQYYTKTYWVSSCN
jgi:hypothetical protein